DYEQKEDMQAKAKLFATVHKDMGIPLSIKQVRDTLQIEEPRDKADTLAPAPEAEKPSTNDPLDDSLIESAFAEGDSVKKKLLPGSSMRSSSRTARFMRQRPSTIKFSDD
ncbi:MAG TPA: hypothetical protein VGO43_08085, partial [Pyrinomonadaceae bacterium]|nr:hypothetical protein [Pyrinomonadaceae bacterium]